MSKLSLRIALTFALGSTLSGSGVSSLRAAPDSAPGFTVPETPLRPVTPGLQGFGPDGPLPAPQPNPQGKPDETKTAEPKANLSRQDMLDRLFDRLAKATDADEANGIAGLIQHVWMHSGSDTATSSCRAPSRRWDPNTRMWL